jgi:hypothetical protein
MAIIVVNKLDVAKRQINSAIRMLFSKEDPIAIHTVAAAGYRITRDLIKIHGINHPTLVDNFLRPEKRTEFWKIFNGPANFFKHADADPDAVLDTVDEAANDYVLFQAITAYAALGAPGSVEMEAYRGWFILCHPHFFPAAMDLATKVIGPIGIDLQTMNREQRLEQGGHLLEAYRRSR